MKLSATPQISYSVTYPYVFWDGWFSEPELKAMEEYCSQKEVSTGTVGSGVVDLKIRDSNVSMHGLNNDNKWMFDKFLNLTDHLNNTFYNMDLLGFDIFQYTEYNTEGSKYEPHMDMMIGDEVPIDMRIPRKLSLSLILSNPSEYTGGEFEFLVGGEPKIAEQKRGRVLAFPSYIVHGVRPITSGKRRSIVIWAVGPKFR
jgi:PKHD-type hydroxylase